MHAYLEFGFELDLSNKLGNPALLYTVIIFWARKMYKLCVGKMKPKPGNYPCFYGPIADTSIPVDFGSSTENVL